MIMNRFDEEIPFVKNIILNKVQKRAKAFTLVELLVVISIIALLLAILMPSLNAARSQAQKIVCTSNMRNLGLATSMYLLENKDQYPSPKNCWSYSWYQSLATYVDTAAKDIGKVSNPTTSDVTKKKNVFKCPSSNNPLRQPYKDYSGAWWDGASQSNRFGIIWYSAPGGTSGRKFFSCRRQGDIRRTHGSVVWLAEFPNNGVNVPGASDTFIYSKWNVPWAKQFGNRHKGDNALFVDGHVGFKEKSVGLIIRDFYAY